MTVTVGHHRGAGHVRRPLRPCPRRRRPGRPAGGDGLPHLPAPRDPGDHALRRGEGLSPRGSRQSRCRRTARLPIADCLLPHLFATHQMSTQGGNHDRRHRRKRQGRARLRQGPDGARLRGHLDRHGAAARPDQPADAGQRHLQPRRRHRLRPGDGGAVDDRRAGREGDRRRPPRRDPGAGAGAEPRHLRGQHVSTYNIFEAARQLGIRNVVWASSETVYGIPYPKGPAYVPVDEEIERPGDGLLAVEADGREDGRAVLPLGPED